MQTVKVSKSVNSLVIVIIISLFYGCSTENKSNETSGALSLLIDSLKNNSYMPEGERIYNPGLVIKLYDKNGVKPSPKWTDNSNISQLISSIRNASLDGLLPEDYHLSELEHMTEALNSGRKIKATDQARFDLMLTDAFLLLSSHIAEGKTDRDTINPQWNISRRTIINNWNSFMDSTLLSKNITGSIQNLTPHHREYNNLKKALLRFRQYEEKGGWQPFNTKLLKLEPGLRHPDVSILRKRLAFTQGESRYIPEDEDLFDKSLADEVMVFQKANGLDPDGVVGKSTIDALNITVKERIETLEANLERWRWLSDDLGKCYIRVNIADFSLQVLEDGKPVFHSLAVVGGPYKQTPVFSSSLRYMVVNPDWVIPAKIIKEEIIPAIKKNPDYLVENNMKVIRLDGTEVDTSTINWKKIIPDNFPYMIRQEPCEKNALGHVAFMFPNEYSVYIHDTPAKYLFSKSSRAFSHGCIRINKAHELAEYLINNSRGWDTAHLETAIALGKKEIISLKNPIPVYILYLTASANDDGSASFSKDIYDHDNELIHALKLGPSEYDKRLAEAAYVPEPLPEIPGNSFKKRDIP